MERKQNNRPRKTVSERAMLRPYYMNYLAPTIIITLNKRNVNEIILRLYLT